MRAVLELTRPGNLALGVFGTLVGALVGSGAGILGHTLEVLAGCIVVLTFMAGGNSLNDYTDRETDKVNHPGRPIPSGRIKARTALIFSAVMFSTGLAVSLMLPPTAVVIVMTAAILMTAYDMKIKRNGIFGNVVISALVGMLFLFGGALVENMAPTMVLAMLAGLVSLAREIVKDVEDIEGDKDRRTLPMAVGPNGALAIAGSMVVFAVYLSPIPIIFGLLGPAYLYLVVPADAIFIYSMTQFGRPTRASRLLKTAMALGLMAFLAGGLT